MARCITASYVTLIWKRIHVRYYIGKYVVLLIIFFSLHYHVFHSSTRTLHSYLSWRKNMFMSDMETNIWRLRDYHYRAKRIIFLYFVPPFFHLQDYYFLTLRPNDIFCSIIFLTNCSSWSFLFIQSRISIQNIFEIISVTD
jgi:hypothetical protein